jgi:hypothetical protein
VCKAEVTVGISDRAQLARASALEFYNGPHRGRIFSGKVDPALYYFISGSACRVCSAHTLRMCDRVQAENDCKRYRCPKKFSAERKFTPHE